MHYLLWDASSDLGSMYCAGKHIYWNFLFARSLYASYFLIYIYMYIKRDFVEGGACLFSFLACLLEITLVIM